MDARHFHLPPKLNHSPRHVLLFDTAQHATKSLAESHGCYLQHALRPGSTDRQSRKLEKAGG